MIRYFQALLCFYIRIHKQQPRCLKILFNCHFICEMAKKPRRIPEEKVFVTRKLSKGVTTVKIAKVLQRDHREIKRHVTTIQQKSNVIKK